MTTYEITTKINIQDSPESEFEKVKRDVLTRINPDTHRFLLIKDDRSETVIFNTFSKSTEGEILIEFQPIRNYIVAIENCRPAEVHSLAQKPFDWTEKHIFLVGYRTKEIKEAY